MGKVFPQNLTNLMHSKLCTLSILSTYHFDVRYAEITYTYELAAQKNPM